MGGDDSSISASIFVIKIRTPISFFEFKGAEKLFFRRRPRAMCLQIVSVAAATLPHLVLPAS